MSTSFSGSSLLLSSSKYCWQTHLFTSRHSLSTFHCDQNYTSYCSREISIVSSDHVFPNFYVLIAMVCSDMIWNSILLYRSNKRTQDSVSTIVIRALKKCYHSWEAIYSSMYHKSPPDQFVMTIHMPHKIWRENTIKSAFYSRSVTFSNIRAINTMNWFLQSLTRNLDVTTTQVSLYKYFTIIRLILLYTLNYLIVAHLLGMCNLKHHIFNLLYYVARDTPKILAIFFHL